MACTASNRSGNINQSCKPIKWPWSVPWQWTSRAFFGVPSACPMVLFRAPDTQTSCSSVIKERIKANPCQNRDLSVAWVPTRPLPWHAISELSPLYRHYLEAYYARKFVLLLPDSTSMAQVWGASFDNTFPVTLWRMLFRSLLPSWTETMNIHVYSNELAQTPAQNSNYIIATCTVIFKEILILIN